MATMTNDKCLCPWRFQWNIICVLLTEIGNAYAVLSNPDKRRQYDLVGSEEPSSPGHSHRGGFDFHRGFEADITPDDLFNMFFGGGFPSCKRTSLCRCTLPELEFFSNSFDDKKSHGCFVFVLLSTASPHTFNNGRTSYSHDTDYRQERTDDRGDVCVPIRKC